MCVWGLFGRAMKSVAAYATGPRRAGEVAPRRTEGPRGVELRWELGKLVGDEHRRASCRREAHPSEKAVD